MSVFKNPFFIACCGLFWLNQFLERILQIYIPIVHAYLDDLLAMPVVLGITLQIFRWIHPLRDRFRFSVVQIIVGWIYFSILFEILLPNWSETYTADVFDVVCYAVGSWLFYILINKN